MYYIFTLLDEDYYVKRDKLIDKIVKNTINFKSSFCIRNEKKEKYVCYIKESLNYRKSKTIPENCKDGYLMIFNIAYAKMNGSYDNNRNMITLFKYIEYFKYKYEFTYVNFKLKKLYFKINEEEVSISTGFGIKHLTKENLNSINTYNDTLNLIQLGDLKKICNDSNITYIKKEDSHIYTEHYTDMKNTRTRVNELEYLFMNINTYKNQYLIVPEIYIELFNKSYDAILARLSYNKDCYEKRIKENFKENILLTKEVSNKGYDPSLLFNEDFIKYIDLFNQNKKEKESYEYELSSVNISLKKLKGELSIDKI